MTGRRSEDLLAPCGTEAAARRHWRRREPPCETCRLAAAAARAARNGHQPLANSADHRQVRNGLPETPRYTWRARTYRWAQDALAAAEAVHGSPDDAWEATAGA